MSGFETRSRVRTFPRSLVTPVPTLYNERLLNLIGSYFQLFTYGWYGDVGESL